MPIFALLMLARVLAECSLPICALRLNHLGTCLGGVLPVRKVHRQVLDSDITATDLNVAAATCVFGDETTPLREVREYTLRNLVSRQRGQLDFLTFFPGPLT